MDIRQLSNFLEVARQMNFTKAAQNMYISQQGISKSIRALEAELGVQLFTRNLSSISLTEYGKVLLTYGEQMEKLYFETLGRLKEISESNKNSEIRIGFPHGFVTLLPYDIFEGFNRTHEDCMLNFREYSDFEIDEALIEGEIDIGFCISPLPSNLVVHATRSERTFFMISEKSPLAANESLNMRLLAGESFISFGKDTKGHLDFAERCSRAGFSPRIAYSTQDVQMMRKLVANNAGISFYVGNSNEKIDGVKILPDSSGNWHCDINICTKKGKILREIESELISCFNKW